jgi:hypothetical protein
MRLYFMEWIKIQQICGFYPNEAVLGLSESGAAPRPRTGPRGVTLSVPTPPRAPHANPWRGFHYNRCREAAKIMASPKAMCLRNPTLCGYKKEKGIGLF